MPGNEKEIKVKITAKDQASKELTAAMDKVKTTAKVAFAAITGAVALSVNAAGKFEKAMNNVYTLVDRNKEAFRDMEGDLKDMAAQVPVSMDQLTEGLYDVRSAGIGAGDAMGVLKKSAMLGVAGLGTTKEAVGIATSALNAFKLSGKDADKALNTIFLTVKAGKTTISELSQSFGMVAGIAATLGINFDELQAATAALTTTGQKASVAQTQLKAAMLSIAAPTDAMIALLKKAGIADGAAALAKEGLVSVMGKIDKAAKGNEGTLKAAYGSVEALGAAVSLTGNQASAFETALKSMQGSGEVTEDVMKDLTEAFELQKATFSSQSEILKNQVNIAMIELGNIVLPILIEKMDALAKVIENVSIWWAGLDQDTKDNIATTIEWTLAMLAGSLAIAKLVETFKTLQAILVGLKALSTVASTLSAISLLKFGAIGALIIALTWIVMNWSDVSNGLQEIAKWLGIIGETSRDAELSLSRLQTTSVRVGNEIGTKVSIDPKFYGSAKTIMDPDYKKYMNLTTRDKSQDKITSSSAYNPGLFGKGGFLGLGYADGGRMSAGETRLVGEEGPERFMPDVSGMIIPNDQLGGQQITMVFSNNQFLDSTGAEKIMELAFQKFKLINKI